jgi:hypothetical protein
MVEQTPIDLEWNAIRQPIKNIAQAKTLIYDDARKRFSSLNWLKYNITQPEVYFDFFFPEVIGKLSDSKLVTLSDRGVSGTDFIHATPDIYKTILNPNEQKRLWLVMKENEISPKEATFLKDYLLLQTPVTIAFRQSLNFIEVARSFKDANPDIRQAIFRIKLKNPQTDFLFYYGV